MNEIVKAGLIGAGFISSIGLLLIFINWFSTNVDPEEKIWKLVKAIVVVIVGLLIFLMLSITVGSLLLS